MDERRKYTRLEKLYRIEYGPFETLVNKETLKTSTLVNLSGGGALFCSEDAYAAGSQLFLKIYIAGWCHDEGELIKIEEKGRELTLKVVAEVVRSEFDESRQCHLIGTKFLGQVQP